MTRLLPGHVAGHREGLQENLRPGDRGAEIEENPAVEGLDRRAKIKKSV